jgi:hypothetical protein
VLPQIGVGRETWKKSVKDTIIFMETLTRPKETTKLPLPPIVSGAPILGSARDMLKDPLMFMVRAHEQYGPIFRVRALHLEYTILAGLEANQFLAR